MSDLVSFLSMTEITKMNVHTDTYVDRKVFALSLTFDELLYAKMTFGES